MRVGVINQESWLRSLNWIGLPLIAAYIFCMFLSPWVDGKGSWKYVLSVWHSWQALNVGMLAFLSSVIAFNIARYNERKQRNRNFVAERAFLPEALSELTSYFRSCSPVLIEAWEKANVRNTKSPLMSEKRTLPIIYKEVFRKCISFAEPDVGEYLAYILMRFQIHNARLDSLYSEFSEHSTMIVLPQNIESYMYCLAELQALVNKIFNFARGGAAFPGSNLDWEDFNNSYATLGIDPENINDLVGFTQRAISRSGKQ